jgi:ABC-type dipeptide/oligopeptide/nickel transport system permease subunit
LRNRVALFGFVVIVFMVAIALLAPLISPFDPNAQAISSRLEPPSWQHLLGTDEFGRDILSRIIWGARISLSVGVSVILISISVGTIMGAVSGYYGGWVDMVLMRIADVFLSFPGLILAIGIIAVLGPSLLNVVVTLALVSWPSTARIVRGEALSLRNAEYVQASKSIGVRGFRILTDHIIPNTLAPVIVVATLGIGFAILAETGLSFLGIGVPPPTADWGAMISAGRDYIIIAPSLLISPGVAICLLVLAFNLLGDGLRDALDPSLRI